eukprot:249832-Chlamydomonas_euryale.AAC.8
MFTLMICSWLVSSCGSHLSLGIGITRSRQACATTLNQSKYAHLLITAKFGLHANSAKRFTPAYFSTPVFCPFHSLLHPLLPLFFPPFPTPPSSLLPPPVSANPEGPQGRRGIPSHAV